MLDKSHRLPPRISFKGSKTFHTDEFLLKVQPNTLSVSRFGFVISKKIDSRATKRNRMRRLLMSVIRERLLEAYKGYDMLFILKNTFEEKDQIEKIVLEAVRQL